jgi:hypothetical protein
VGDVERARAGRKTTANSEFREERTRPYVMAPIPTRTYGRFFPRAQYLGATLHSKLNSARSRSALWRDLFLRRSP